MEKDFHTTPNQVYTKPFPPGGYGAGLHSLISSRNWKGVDRLLTSLSNIEFKRIQQTARLSILPALDNDLYWETLLHLIIYKRPAFLAGASSCANLAKNGTLNFDNDYVKSIYEYLRDTNPESLIKAVNMILQHLNSVEQMEKLFRAFHIENEISRLSALLRVDSPASYYLIFRTLKMVDDKVIARKCCISLIRRNNDMAFNAVSLIKSYWAIDDLPLRFSLNIEPYELNHIDRSYTNFLKILNGKRPSI